MNGRVLIIAGSDPSGGAGIQADIKTCTAHNVYAQAAITALTAQNTRGVFGIQDVPELFITQQISLCLSDIGADAIKTGMLHTAGVIHAVANAIKVKGKGIPLVVDPVMVAKGGAPLLEANAIKTLKVELLPMALLATPNLPEAELLSGIKIESREDMVKAGEAILALGAQAVLVKGGHAEGTEVTDILVQKSSKPLFFSNKKIETQHTHGTGCTLASAIACGIAAKKPLEQAVEDARAYVLKAMETAPGYGQGHGPLNHMHSLAKKA